MAENQAAGTSVGTFTSADPDAGSTFTYSLVSGTGSTDNGSFAIAGDRLRTGASFDFEVKSSYSIRVRTTDNTGRTFEKQFTIAVTDVNEAPTDAALSSSSIAENQPSGTTVGTLSATDEDAGQTHTFSLATSCIGGPFPDNNAFTIAGGDLQTALSFDFEAQTSYTICVRATDDGALALSLDKQLTISVTNVNEAPTDVALSDSSIAENEPSGTSVGSFSSTDPDTGDTFAYSLVAGTGSDDNGSFTISGSTLQTNAAFDVETKASYSIRVRTTDAGSLSFEKQLTISVTNVNEAPTDLALSSASVAENQPSGTGVGSLSTTDPDAGDTAAYSLVAGTGSDDNGSFAISGSTLQTSASFDFETKSSYSIRVRTTDSGSLGFEKVFTVTVTNVNEAPTDLALSSSSVQENQPSGTTVGALSATDEDAGQTHTFSLASSCVGGPFPDNSAFTIAGGDLQTALSFDFEAKSSYTICVRATDDGTPGLSFDKQLAVTVTNVNEAPTDLALSSSTVPENQPSGTTVGTLSTTDPDAGDTAGYSLVAGTGSADNGSFTISGNTLQTNAAFDFETKSSYSIRVRTTDAGSLSFEKALTITVTNVNEAPSDLALSSSSVAENQPSGTTVGSLSTTDPDAGDTFTYSLVSGTGSGDNGSFTITGNTLQTSAVFNFEAKSSYSIRVRTTDSGSLTFEKQLTISVTNVNEAPTNVALTPSSIAENQPSGTTVGALSATDEDAGQTHAFTLQSAGCGGGPFPDNASFTVSGGNLQSAASFNFEAKSSYTVCVRATDNGTPALSFDKQLTVTVTNVNEAPTDIALSNASVSENQPSGTTVGSFSATDPDAGDTATFSLVSGTGSGDNGSFTISGNTLQTSAVFDFETKSSYSIRVRATDGGSLTFEKIFTITVLNVNEAPVNTVPGGQTVNEDTNLTFSSGGGNAISIADVDAGANPVKLSLDVAHGTLTLASTTGLTFVDGTANISASVHVTGTLTNINAALAGLVYRGAANYNSTRGAETLSVVTNDQGNSGSGGPLSDTDTVAITVSAVNDAPSAAAHSYSAQANMKINGLSSLFSGASDPDTGDGGYTATFTIGTVSATSPAGGTVTVNADGTFDFDPPAGVTGNVTFTYTVCDSGNPAPAACSAAATVTISVAGPVIWFVNAGAGTNGSGTLNSPFNTLAAANAVDASNQGIFLFSSATSYTGALTLNSGEKLIGQATTGTTFDSIFGINPPTGTIVRPTLGSGTVTMTGTVTLASTDTLRGLALSTSTSTGLAGSGGLTGIDVAQVSVSTTTATAVNLNNASGTYAFSGIATGNTGASPGFSAVSSGTVNVTGSANTLATTTGTALNVTNTNIGASGLTFLSISANGAPNGIVLNTTGASGGLSVTGTGTTAGTGGTIQNVVNRGLSAISTSSLSLKNMNFTGDGTVNGDDPTVATSTCGDLITGSNTGCNAAIHMDGVTGATLDRVAVSGGNQIGINGNNVTDLTLSNSTVQNAGDQTREDGVRFKDLKGTSSITSSTLQGNEDNQLRIANNTGAVGTLTISSSTFQNSTNPNGEYAFQLDTFGSGSFTTTIGTSTFNNTRGGGLVATAQGSSTLNVTTSGGTWHGNFGAISNFDSAIQIVAADSANVKFNVHDITNPMLGYGLNVIHFQTDSPGTENLQGQVINTVIGDSSSSTSASTTGAGIGFNEQSTSNSKIRFSGNTIQGVATFGITMQMGNLTTAATTVDAIVQNNTISVTNAATALQGIFVNSGTTSASGARPADAGTFCAQIGGSAAGNVASSVNADGLRVRQRFETTVRLPGYGGGVADTAAVNSFLGTNNPSLGDTISSTVPSPFSGGGFVGGAACAAPTLP